MEEPSNEERRMAEDGTDTSVSGFSSDSSPREPFRPLFQVSFAGHVSKDGDVLTYTLKARKTNGQEYTVKRCYQDFEHLHHCLATENATPGLIMPPLPPKPAVMSAESRRRMGPDCETVVGDEFDLDRDRLETYLNLLSAHPTYGADVRLEKFLTEREVTIVSERRHRPAPEPEEFSQAPPRTKARRGVLDRLSSSLESRKEGHKDCDEFFRRERDFVTECCTATKAAGDAFDERTFAVQRLCGLLSHLATATVAAATVGNGGACGGAATKVASAFSKALEGTKARYEELCHGGRTTLGSCLELYSRYLAAEKDMLLRRTCLLVDYESSNCAVSKAKPHRMDAALRAKQEAEKAFEACSDVARQEIQRLHRRRVADFARNLERYAQEELRASRDVCSLLTLALAEVKEIPQ